MDEYLVSRRGLRSLRVLRCHSVALLALLGHRRAVRVTTADLAAYEAAREAVGEARATINRDLELLRAAFRLGATSKPRRISPSKVPAIRVPKVHNARRGFVSHEQAMSIIEGIRNPDLRDFLAWRYWTAMRPIEAARLTWSDVDLGAGIVTLPADSDKIGKGRSLAVAGPLRAILERRQARRIVGCDLVFHRRASGKRGEPIRQYRKAWASACRAAGFLSGSRVEGGLIPYDLRRSGLRNLVRAGVSETVAMGISGHRTRATFDRYNITSVEDTREALEAVSAWTQEDIRTKVGQPTKKGA